MLHYFQLQFRLLNRHIRDFGLNPWLGWPLAAVLFVGLSQILFNKTILAGYVILLMALSTVSKLSAHDRNDFLQTCFPSQFHRIRLLENALVALPFLVVLLAKVRFWEATGLATATLVLAFIKWGIGGNFTLPTPFGKRPFEFLVGFRKTYYLYIGAIFLTIMAILYHNFNLGIFALLLVFLISMAYYSNLEMGYYVWIHTQQPRAFLRNKIITAVRHSTVLSLPLAIVLAMFFKENIAVILAAQALGYVYLAMMILAKYAAYPNGIGLPQSLLLAFSFTMPPLLLFTVPFFYKKSINRLALILE
jgi:hypothetical protein